jgi:hypothetical protein
MSTVTGESGGPNAAEAAVPGPQWPLEARGASSGGSATPGGDTGQANAKGGGARFGFESSKVQPFVPLKLSFPLWPETSARPVFFKLDFLLSADADAEQSSFLQLTEPEQAAESYRYDCRMLALLCVAPPEGLLDFEYSREDYDAENPEHRKELAAAVFSYLFRPDTEQARAFAYMARHFMSRYWSKVAPKEYL